MGQKWRRWNLPLRGSSLTNQRRKPGTTQRAIVELGDGNGVIAHKRF